jgi:hypothetical protein
MHFNKFGYEYISDENSECFDNIMLVYDNGEIYWITCSNESLKDADKYFENLEIFIMGFSLKRRSEYNMEFMTNIKFKDIYDDMKDNGLDNKIKLLFSEREYNKYLNFKIIAKNFDDVIMQLKMHLSTLNVELI